MTKFIDYEVIELRPVRREDGNIWVELTLMTPDGRHMKYSLNNGPEQNLFLEPGAKITMGFVGEDG